MTPREAFKFGFLLACADRGESGEQVQRCMAKAAALLKGAGLPGLGDVASAAQPLGNLAATAAVALPIMGGAGLGYLAHRAAVPEVDEDDIKKQELIEELKHYARRAREHQRVKALRAALGG